MTPQELVQREVIYCVSCLIYELREVAERLDDYDEYLNLTGGKPDFEEAASYFIMNDADLFDLETIVEQNNYWSDVVDEVKTEFPNLLHKFVVEFDDAEGEAETFECWAETSEHAEEQCLNAYPGATHLSVTLDDADIDEYCYANTGLLDALRKATLTIIDEDEEHEWVCSEFNLDVEYDEIYEHWIVSDWLGRKLSERGHVVESYLGMTIWGRGCTGQAIYMDSVMEQICNDL